MHILYLYVSWTTDVCNECAGYLVEKSNGEMKTEPYVPLWKPGLNLMKDTDPIVRILFVS